MKYLIKCRLFTCDWIKSKVVKSRFYSCKKVKTRENYVKSSLSVAFSVNFFSVGLDNAVRIRDHAGCLQGNET